MAIIGGCQLALATGNRKYVDFSFELADELTRLQRSSEFPGQFYKERKNIGSIRTADNAMYAQAILCSLKLSIAVNDKKRIKRYKKSSLTAIENILSLQYTRHNTINYKNKSASIGGFRRAHASSSIQLDATTQSMALLKNALDVHDLFK